MRVRFETPRRANSTQLPHTARGLSFDLFEFSVDPAVDDSLRRREMRGI
jgi:hypothetical protein